MRKAAKVGAATLLAGLGLSACTIYTNTDANVNVDSGGLEAILHNSVSSDMEIVTSYKCGVSQVQGPSNPGSSALFTIWWNQRTANEAILYELCTQQAFNALYTAFGGDQAAQARAAFQDMGNAVDGGAWFNAAFIPGVEEQSGAGWVPGSGCYVFQMGPLGNFEYWTNARGGGSCV